MDVQEEPDEQDEPLTIKPGIDIYNKMREVLRRDKGRVTQADRDTLMGYMDDFMELLSSQNTRIAMLQIKLADLNELNETHLDPLIEDSNRRNREFKKSYADIVRNRSRTQFGSQQQEREHITIIRPIEEGCSSDKTRSDIINGLDPAHLRVGIKKIINIKNGGVLIQTDKPDGIDCIRLEMEKTKLTKEYRVEAPKLRLPTVILFGVDEEVEAEELESTLCKQNPEIEEDHVRIIAGLKVRNKKRHWILEIAPASFNKIRYKDKLNLYWRRHNFEETFGIRQCYKCAGIGHVAANCTNSQICRHCSSTNHMESACDDRPHCYHCEKANQKYRLRLEEDHSPFDRECQQHIRARNRQMKRTKYD
nr:uncharacterized protein LOC122273126 [Parasteatoda tepidariorum]